jgi:hypothetical protein
VPDNAGWAFAVLVVFQDLFIGAFFSGTLVTVIIFALPISHVPFGDLIAGCRDGFLLSGTEGMAGEQGLAWPPHRFSHDGGSQEEPLEGADSLSAVRLR